MATPNPYDIRADENQAKALDENHATRWITGNWGDNDLTQRQWDTIRPRIITMLEGKGVTYHTWTVGPRERLRTYEEAKLALNHTHSNDANDVFTPADEAHNDALEWALVNLLENEVLDCLIQRIMGAAITCLIQPLQPLGQPIIRNAILAYKAWASVCTLIYT